MLRLITTLLGILLLIVVAAALLIPIFIDKDKVIELAAQAIEKETGAALEVNGELQVSFYPNIGIAFSEAALTMPEKEQPDIEIAAATLGVRLIPLFKGQVEVDSIDLAGLTARLESTPEERVDTSGYSDAQLEAYYAQRRSARRAAGDTAGAEAALAVPLALTVSSLKLRDVRLETRDTSTGETSVVELTSLTASDLNLDGEPIPLALSLRIPGDNPLLVDLEGEVTVDQDAEVAQFSELQIAVEGIATEPLRLTLNGTYDIARQAADATVQLALDEMRGSGNLRYANFESPQIDADLSLNLFDPVLFALAGPEAAASTAEAPTSSGDDPLPLDALRSIDTRAKLRIGTARFGDHDLNDVAVQLRAVEGEVTLRQLTATVHEGQLQASATLNGRLSTAKLQTRGGVQSLDLAAAMAAGEAAGRLRGQASLNWELNGSGRTQNELLRSLGGPIQLDTTDVTLVGTSVDKLLCQAVALTNQEELTTVFPEDTQFSNISATVQLRDGKAVLAPLRAELENIQLTGTGEFDLLQQSFKADFAARLSPDLEEVDRACRLNSRLTAMDFPVTCKGELAGDPGDWCGVDSSKIIRDLAVTEGRRKVEKKASKLLNKFLQKRSQDEAGDSAEDQAP